MKQSALLLLMLVLTLFGAPHSGELFDLTQPDGKSVTVKVWGDEFYQMVESPDGYTLVRDDAGWICYAELNADGTKLLSTGERFGSSTRSAGPAHGKKGIDISASARIAEVQKSPWYTQKNSRAGSRAFDLTESELTGPVTGLTILIDFSDQTSKIGKDEIEKMINMKGYTGYGCSGSVRDYYSDVSGGKLEYTNIVTAFYRAKKPKSYYDENVQSGTKASELIKEAVQGVQNIVDFSKLTKRDGEVVALNIMYAGTPTWGWAKGLWPHMYYLNRFTVGGTVFNAYQMTSIGTDLKLSTFCHENGHMIGQWPDLYDYQSDGTNSAGVGNFCLMCHMGNEKNPVPPNAFFRSLVGWEKQTDISSTPKGTLITLPSNGCESLVYKNRSNSSELFVIESRNKTGRNASLPSSGLAVWHVDKSQKNNDYETRTSTRHYMVSLEQADGLYNLEGFDNSGDSKDLFSAVNGKTFSDASTPSAKWWNGSASGLHLGNISAAGSSMTFTIGDEQVTGFTITASAGTGGTITPKGAVTVASGADQKFTITADAGYVIDSIAVNGKSAGAVGTYTFAKVSANGTIAAAFKKAEAEKFTITASAGTGGTISPKGAVSVTAGADQKFTITADAGYVIDSIAVNGKSAGAVGTYTFAKVSANGTIEAAFKKAEAEKFTITASAGTGGTISPKGAVSVTAGADQKFTVTAENGYEISDIMVDGKSVGAKPDYTFVKVSANGTITASFKKLPVLNLIAPNGGEEFAPDSSIKVQWGSAGGNVTVELLDRGKVIDTLGKELTGTELVWKIPAGFTESDSLKIRVSDSKNSDLSDSVFAVHKIIISGSLVRFGNWYVTTDEYTGENGSKASLDSTGFASEGWIGASLSTGKKDEPAKIYPSASLVCELDTNLGKATGVTVTYLSETPFTLVLDQEDLSADGESWFIPLPACKEWSTVTKKISQFTQPEWVEKARPMNLEKVKEISFQPVEAYGTTVGIKVKNLQIKGMIYDPVSLVQTKRVLSPMKIAGYSNGALKLETARPGTYRIELISLAGRVIHNSQAVLAGGISSVNIESSAAGMTIVRITGNGMNYTGKLLIK